MRTGQVAGAEEEFAGDLAAGEAERLLEEPDPVGSGPRVVCVEPAGEGAELVAQHEQAARVLDRRVDLQPVADDARVTEQPSPLAPAVGRDARHVEAVVGVDEGGTLLEDGQPGEPGLIDLEHEPFEELPVVADREAVLAVVIRAVDRMPGRGGAVAHASGDAGGGPDSYCPSRYAMIWSDSYISRPVFGSTR